MNFGNCMVKAKTPVDCILSEFLGHGVGFYVAWSLQRFYVENQCQALWLSERKSGGDAFCMELI